MMKISQDSGVGERFVIKTLRVLIEFHLLEERLAFGFACERHGRLILVQLDNLQLLEGRLADGLACHRLLQHLFAGGRQGHAS